MSIITAILGIFGIGEAAPAALTEADFDEPKAKSKKAAPKAAPKKAMTKAAPGPGPRAPAPVADDSDYEVQPAARHSEEVRLAARVSPLERRQRADLVLFHARRAQPCLQPVDRVVLAIFAQHHLLAQLVLVLQLLVQIVLLLLDLQHLLLRRMQLGQAQARGGAAAHLATSAAPLATAAG